MSLAKELGLEDFAWAATKESAQKEAPRVVEALARAAELIAESRVEQHRLEAGHRHWRSVTMADILARHPKTSEWKARSEAEATVQQRTWQDEIAEVVERVQTLEGYQTALLAKRDFIVAILAA